MKIISITLLLMIMVANVAPAQVGVFNKVKNKVNQRVDSKVDKAIDQTLDKIEGKETTTTTTTTPANTTVEKNTATNEDPAPMVSAIGKYDFIPGEKVIYYDDFGQEAIAELPNGWNTNGSGEVVNLSIIPGKWLRLHHPFNYLSRNEKEFGDNYTVEFDVVMQLKNNGWMYPTFSIGLVETRGASTTGNEYLVDFKKHAAVIAAIDPGESKNSRMKVGAYLNNSTYFTSAGKPVEGLEQYYGKPVHIAIQVQKERYRFWINEVKAYDIPKAVPAGSKFNQLVFQVGSSNYKDDQYGMYVSNIKVAQGVPDARHQLVEEGRFSTTAILFDVNTATIKPESGGVLKEIANVLNQHPAYTISIIGHTDSDGNDAHNLELSKKRAAAVKEVLVKEYNVDGMRITTDGKGESVPAVPNTSSEGKAQNRRVEFIKG